VGHRHSTDFLRTRHKSDAVLSGAKIFTDLEADAAETTGVADGRCGERRFPSVHEEVSGCGASVGDSTLAQVLNEAVPALFLHPAAGIPFDDFGVEMPEVLALVGIDPHSGHVETVIEPPHGGIGE
jgi:hypothetical protein